MVISREAYSTNGMILNGWVDAFNHFERGLCLCGQFNEAGNLRLSGDLYRISRAIVRGRLCIYLGMDTRHVEFSKFFACRGSIHLSCDIIFSWGYS